MRDLRERVRLSKGDFSHRHSSGRIVFSTPIDAKEGIPGALANALRYLVERLSKPAMGQATGWLDSYPHAGTAGIPCPLANA